jgi:methylmalonyl-CoA/ethylmalonyl-CoA epimerase
LNHVGVATSSIEQSIALYHDLLGATKIHEPSTCRHRGCGCASSTR